MKRMGLALLVCGIVVAGFASISSAGADYVALIWRTDGDTMIQSGEKEKPAKMAATLKLGDRIALEKGASMVLLYFSNGKKEKITGPANIIIGKTGSEILGRATRSGTDKGKDADPIGIIGWADIIDGSNMIEAFASGIIAATGVRGSFSDDEEAGKIILLAPVSYVMVRSPHPEFRWKAYDGAEKYRLRIFAPDGNLIFETTTAETAFNFDCSGLNYGEMDYTWTVSALKGGKEIATSDKGFFDVISEAKFKALAKAEERVETDRLMSLVILYMANGLDLEAAEILRQLKEKQPNNEYIRDLLFQLTGNMG